MLLRNKDRVGMQLRNKELRLACRVGTRKTSSAHYSDVFFRFDASCLRRVANTLCGEKMIWFFKTTTERCYLGADFSFLNQNTDAKTVFDGRDFSYFFKFKVN